MSVETAPPASSLKNTKWDRPEYTLPKPSLKFLFHLECNMESFMHISNGPHGDRSTVIFKGGRFEGPELRGEILPGGGGNINSLSMIWLPLTVHRLGDCAQSRRRPTNSSPRYSLQPSNARRCCHLPPDNWNANWKT
jgi:hypothetical protein